MSEYGFEDHVVDVPLTHPTQQPPVSDKFKHPVCVFFHFLFKVTAILFYFLEPAGFVLNFIFCILSIAFDFYTVKNVSGRLLVGLRWWNDAKIDGTSEWIFESVSDQRAINQTEALLFWVSLYLMPVIWMLLTFGCILGINFRWISIPITGISLGMANVYGYMKCAKDQRERLQGMAQRYAQSYIAQSIMNRTSSFFG